MDVKNETLCSLFHRQALRYGDRYVFLKGKFDDEGKPASSYHLLTWKDVRDQVVEFAGGLLSFGAKKGDRVALFSESRPRWIIADQAIQAAGCIGVPLYPTLAKDELTFMLRDSGAGIIIVSTADKASMALKIRTTEKLDLIIIVMETWKAEKTENLYTFSEVRELGQSGMVADELGQRMEAVRPEDSASIIYTSGTTEDPKGVVLTQANWVAAMYQASHSTLIRRQKTRELHLTYLVHLPLCHAYGRTTDYHVGGLHLGGILIFAESYEKLVENIAEVRPNVIISIPRFFEKTHDMVKSAVARQQPFARRLFKWAMEAGSDFTNAMAGGPKMSLLTSLKFGLAHLLVFKRIRENAGFDRLVIGISGGGRLSGDVCSFIRALGIQLNEGYGLTETCALINFNGPELYDIKKKKLTAWEHRMIDWIIDLLVARQAQGKSPYTNPFSALKMLIAYYSIGYRLRVKPGTVGRPVALTEEIIAPDGEILVKGPQVFQGYWNLPKETEAAFNEDGWFMTGDIGAFDSEGFLTIKDRKKELLVTSGGKNIAPQPIEHALATRPYIDQAVCTGDGKKYLTALIVPDFKKLRSYAKSKGLTAESEQQLLQIDEIQKLISSDVNEVNRRLPRYEQIKYCTILTQPFLIETGELTPSMKIKRRVIEEKYREEIEAMYGE